MRTHKGHVTGQSRTRAKEASHSRDARIDEPLRELAATAKFASGHSDASIVIIDRRSLVAECMATCLTTILGVSITSFSDLESWLRTAGDSATSLVVFCSPGGMPDVEQHRDRKLLLYLMERLPTVIVADGEDVAKILAAIDSGARGYIPTNLSLKVVVEAIRLVKAGGVFVPANSLLAARQSGESSDQSGQGTPMFTVRQAAVVQALCKGKANKLIAHELNMRESTVKVHVRNIMKKLSARNRTEVALMASGLQF